LWGNCDRYGAYDFSVPVRGSNCDGRNNGQFNAASVMQATTPSSPQHLTADDLAGIQEVAQDDNLGANAVWKRFLVAKNSSSGLSNPAKPEQAAPQAPMQEVSCPDLYVYNSTSKMCDWNLGCPAKYIYNKNTRMCDWNRFCPAGYVLNPQTRMCDWYLVCPIGYLYNPQTRMCDLGM
ncbi:MAG: hypothetical protein NTX25_12405, partial [Proteobacteria bacterium]|nr:hypothetical protein [Pseudomonadota bacterium]